MKARFLKVNPAVKAFLHAKMRMEEGRIQDRVWPTAEHLILSLAGLLFK